jgi:hypothetical protein
VDVQLVDHVAGQRSEFLDLFRIDSNGRVLWHFSPTRLGWHTHGMNYVALNAHPLGVWTGSPELDIDERGAVIRFESGHLIYLQRHDSLPATILCPPSS